MNSTLTTILALLGFFFHNNPTAQEIEVLLPEVITAMSNAKVGQAFSVSFPESIDGVKGMSTFGWTPTP